MKPTFVFFLFVWAHALSATCAPKYDAVVTQDGSGNFRTVQAAIDAAPDNSSKETVIDRY